MTSQQHLMSLIEAVYLLNSNQTLMKEQELDLLLKKQIQLDQKELEYLYNSLKLVKPNSKRQIKQYSKIENLINQQQATSIGMSVKSQRQVKVEHQQVEVPLQQNIQPMLQESNSDKFFEHCLRLNAMKAGMSLIDELGNFIMFDDQTKEHLEKSKDVIQTETIFEIMFQPSLAKLEQLNKHSLLRFEKNRAKVQFSVFSDRNRKKAFKYLQVQKKRHLTGEKRKRNLSSESSCSDLGDEINCKYLKCIEMKLTRVQVAFNRICLDSFNHTSMSLNPNHNFISKVMNGECEQSIFQAAICELRETDLQRFTYDQLIEDKKIEKFERKFNKKMEKISQELRLNRYIKSEVIATSESQ